MLVGLSESWNNSFGDDAWVSVLGIGCGRIGSISNPVPIREIKSDP